MLVAVFATSDAILASSFKSVAFFNASFFLETSLIVFAFASISSASFCLAIASAVFCVANPNASSASFFNLTASSLASLASVLAISSNCSFVIFLLVFVFEALSLPALLMLGLPVLTAFRLALSFPAV